jgi:hypothetical protein
MRYSEKFVDHCMREAAQRESEDIVGSLPALLAAQQIGLRRNGTGWSANMYRSAVHFGKSDKTLSPDAGETVTGQLSKPKPPSDSQNRERTSFVGMLKQARAEAVAPKGDPCTYGWERLRGKIGYDAIERVSTQVALDFLEVPQRSRNSAACRRLAQLMRELGWSPIKARGMQNGFREQVRGWAQASSPRALLLRTHPVMGCD